MPNIGYRRLSLQPAPSFLCKNAKNCINFVIVFVTCYGFGCLSLFLYNATLVGIELPSSALGTIIRLVLYGLSIFSFLILMLSPIYFKKRYKYKYFGNFWLLSIAFLMLAIGGTCYEAIYIFGCTDLPGINTIYCGKCEITDPQDMLKNSHSGWKGYIGYCYVAILEAMIVAFVIMGGITYQLGSIPETEGRPSQTTQSPAGPGEPRAADPGSSLQNQSNESIPSEIQQSPVNTNPVASISEDEEEKNQLNKPSSPTSLQGQNMENPVTPIAQIDQSFVNVGRLNPNQTVDPTSANSENRKNRRFIYITFFVCLSIAIAAMIWAVEHLKDKHNTNNLWITVYLVSNGILMVLSLKFIWNFWRASNRYNQVEKERRKRRGIVSEIHEENSEHHDDLTHYLDRIWFYFGSPMMILFSNINLVNSVINLIYACGSKSDDTYLANTNLIIAILSLAQSVAQSLLILIKFLDLSNPNIVADIGIWKLKMNIEIGFWTTTILIVFNFSYFIANALEVGELGNYPLCHCNPTWGHIVAALAPGCVFFRFHSFVMMTGVLINYGHGFPPPPILDASYFVASLFFGFLNPDDQQPRRKIKRRALTF